MKWSYNHTWSKTLLNLINARCETINIKLSFKMAKRCLLLQMVSFSGSELITLSSSVSNELFYLAGIYTKYNGVGGCFIVTREATLLLSEVHQRMSVILADYDLDSWLAGEDVFDQKLLENMECHLVSTIVNSIRNNDKTCVESLPPDS